MRCQSPIAASLLILGISMGAPMAHGQAWRTPPAPAAPDASAAAAAADVAAATDSAAVATDPSKVGEIKGRVASLDGSPLLGVAVVLKVEGGQDQTAITDEAGAYAFAGLVPGSYQLIFAFQDESRQVMQTISAGSTAVQDVVMRNVIKDVVVDRIYTQSLATAEVIHSSPRSYAAQWLVSSGAELRADLRFVTADAGPDGREVRFTDIGLFGMRVRAGVGHHVELAGGVDILPKQPSQTDEDLLQRISFGAAFGPNRRHAIRIDGAGGPMLGDLGLWGSAELALVRRADIEKKILAYQASLVAAGTALRPDEGDPAWFGEVIGRLELVLHTPGGEAGTWVGTSYALPVIERGMLGGAALDPQPRLDVQLGGVVALPSGWDLFAAYTIIDRGDAGIGATTLPVLDGGYDQRQLLVGVTRRIGGDQPRWGRHRDEE